jgi:hypothetical protein
MASIEDLLKTVSLEDMATLATIKSAGIDLGTGQRDVKLNDPLAYATVEVEPAPIPEGAQLETRGTGLNENQVLVGEDVGTNAFTHFLKGLADIATFGVHDFDQSGKLWAPFGGGLEHKKGILPWASGSGYGREWDQEEQNRLKEVQRRNDLTEGRALPTRNEVYEALEGREVLDDYSDARARRKRDDQLNYILAAYPQLAGVINDEIYNRRMQIEYNSPSEIQNRYNASRRGYVDALEGRARAQKNIADATAAGLGRYSGIRVT